MFLFLPRDFSNGVRQWYRLLSHLPYQLQSPISPSTARLFSKMERGALIVFEGGDKSGKTTQCGLLVEALNRNGHKAELVKFPARETSTGRLANDYLQNTCELEDHAIHLIFAANRWENVPKMRKLLDSGVTLIVDRYSYSGVAYSAAKRDMDIRWCMKPEVGLPQPDAVFYLTLPVEAAAGRQSFGEERYEKNSIQQRAAEVYEKLMSSEWKILRADKSIDELHVELLAMAEDVIKSSKHRPLGRLWMDEDGNECLESVLGKLRLTCVG